MTDGQTEGEKNEVKVADEDKRLDRMTGKYV